MNGHRRGKRHGHAAQGDLWNDLSSHPKTEPKEARSSKRSRVDDSAQRKIELLSRELAAMEKRLSNLQLKSQRVMTRNKNEMTAVSKKLIMLLPALFILERMKTVALKETKRIIKPLKPEGGMAISTSVKARTLGSEIGLSPRQSQRVLDSLIKGGGVREKPVGIWELGRFVLDQKARVVPSYYLDIRNSDQLMHLFDSIERG
jgi:hypothetical protein